MALSTSDAARLRTIMRALGAPLRRHLARLGVFAADVDDALQEVLLVAARRLSAIPTESERAFLFAAAYRVASNARRGHRRRTLALRDVAVEPLRELATPEDEACAARAWALVTETLERMPPELGTVLALAELEGMPSEEIARRLDLPDGTVASRLSRARETFAKETQRQRAVTPATRGPGRDLEICSWWVSGGEVDALDAFLRIMKTSHPAMTVSHAAFAGTDTAKKKLRWRMDRGTPPDTFQVNGGTDLSAWLGRSGLKETMESLDFLARSEAWTRAFPSDVLDLVSKGGHVYAVPVDIHRTNVLYYNKHVLAAHGLPVPRTFSDFYGVAEILRARGVTPLAMGLRQPWTLSNMTCESVLVGLAGGDCYKELFTGARPLQSTPMRSALEHVARMLDLANADAHERTWSQAVDLVHSGEAAMTITGDWATGYLSQRGARPGIDFGETASPGAGGTFVYSVDAFGLPTRAAHPAETIDLLRAFGSREGQTAFNQVKGSSPARLDTELPARWRECPRVPSLACVAPAGFTRALDVAMAKFARTRDVGAVLRAMRAHSYLLGQGQPVN